MQASEIRAALDKVQVSDIKHAFQALVLYSHHDRIDGVSAASDMVELLERVVKALDQVSDQMPRELADHIRDESDGHLQGGTYADGAAAVQTCVALWQHRFAINMQGT